jgi:hypothetical protein
MGQETFKVESKKLRLNEKEKGEKSLLSIFVQAILSKNVKAKIKMVMFFCFFEVALKEKKCNELFPSSQWKFEFSDFKIQTLVLTTKTRGFIIPFWVSITKPKVFNSTNIGLQTKNLGYSNHKCFEFLAKNLIDFLDPS